MPYQTLTYKFLLSILDKDPVTRPYGHLEVNTRGTPYEAVVTTIEPNHYKRLSIFGKTLPALLSELIEIHA